MNKYSAAEFSAFSIKSQSDIYREPKSKKSERKKIAHTRSVRERIQSIKEKKELSTIMQEFDSYD